MAAGTSALAQAITPGQVLDHLRYHRMQLSLWERQLIMDLDDKVLPVLNRRRSGPAAPAEGTIPVNDTAATLAMFRALARGEAHG